MCSETAVRDSCRKLFEQLAQVGGPEQQVVCRKKLEEIERTTQYCSYQIRRRGGDVTDTSQLIKMSSKEGAGGDLLQVRWPRDSRPVHMGSCALKGLLV